MPLMFFCFVLFFLGYSYLLRFTYQKSSRDSIAYFTFEVGVCEEAGKRKHRCSAMYEVGGVHHVFALSVRKAKLKRESK